MRVKTCPVIDISLVEPCSLTGTSASGVAACRSLAANNETILQYHAGAWAPGQGLSKNCQKEREYLGIGFPYSSQISQASSPIPLLYSHILFIVKEYVECEAECSRMREFPIHWQLKELKTLGHRSLLCCHAPHPFSVSAKYISALPKFSVYGDMKYVDHIAKFGLHGSRKCLNKQGAPKSSLFHN
jgi:hypothetical protein